MGDDSAGSGLELGWKRAGRCKGVGLLRSARRDGAVRAGLSSRAVLVGLSCRAVLARRLLGERSQAITAGPRTAPLLERLDGIQPPGHRPVEAVSPGSRGGRCPWVGPS